MGCLIRELIRKMPFKTLQIKQICKPREIYNILKTPPKKWNARV